MATNNIGLDTAKTGRTIEKLNKLLSDYQIHYQNLRGFHWNIKGKSFFTLHSVFEKYYDQAAERVDEIAERILMLGGTPMHTYQDYLDNSSLPVYQNVEQCPMKPIADVLKRYQQAYKVPKGIDQKWPALPTMR